MKRLIAKLEAWRDELAAFFGAHRWVRSLVTIILLSLPVVYFLRHLLANPTAVGSFGDIRSFHFWWAVSRQEVVEFGQLPFWDPYYCGGMVHWANVQTMFLSPTFVVNLIFGPGVGLRAHILLHFIAGFLGCWVLARHRGIRGLWSLAPGVVFVFGANLAERATGHIGFMPFLLLPWLAYFLERSRVELRFAIPAGLIIAYCVFAGGPYPFVLFWVYAALFLSYEWGAVLWRILRHKHRLVEEPGRPREAEPAWRSLLRPAAVGGILAGVALSVAAIKLFVVVDFMGEYPRHHSESDYLAAWQVWEVFLEPGLVRHRKGYFYVFGEYRNYLGPIAMLAIPVMLLQVRRRLRDYFMIVTLGALMVGEATPWAPFALLSELPVFSSLRVPVRYAIMIDLHIALLFGQMLTAGADGAVRLRGLFWRRVALGLIAAALVVCAVDLMTNNNTQHEGFFDTPDRAAPRPGPFRMINGHPHTAYQAPLRNEGHIQCYEPNPLHRSRHLRAFAESEVYLAPAQTEGTGDVELTRWTPNRLVLQVDVNEARTVVVNMNYHRDWHADYGTVTSWRGLLAIQVPAGRRAFEVWYQPRRVWLYLSITLLGILACVWIWRSRALRES